MKKTANTARAKGIFVLAMAIVIASIMSGCAGKQNNPKPAPPASSITISTILGSMWKTQSIVCTKSDGTTTTFSDQATFDQYLYVESPTFQTLPSGATLGTANDERVGENFTWSYDSTNNVITMPFDSQDILIATITTLNANTLVWETTGTNEEFGSTYTKIVQTFVR